MIQEAVLGLYAEGAVELIYGNLSFRSERLYLEPPTYKALLLEPRFTGHLPQDVNGAKAKPGRPTPSDLPLHVRARRARLVARGVAVFDEAEMSLSRADDKMALEVTRLIVEEEQPEPGGGEEGEFGSIPTLMGFRSITNQHYTTEGTYLRGERLPLFYWGSANFSYPFSKNFPVRLRGFTFGNRSSTGRYAIATLGGTVTREDEALFDWDVLLGGYLARGPALGGRIRWDRPRTKGKAFAWSVYEFGREEDASGFMPPHPWRWLAEVETRNDLTKKLQFDFEFNDFSDAGVNLEYFENDALTHKDRESYGRLRWSEDLGVATLTGKWHERDDVTETTQLPQAALWSSGVPLVVPRRKGGLAVDLVTRSRFGYLQRRHADIVPYTDPGALRLDTLTTFGAGLDVGDVRLSAWAGPDVDGYMFRDPDATALWRTALAAGARANLQLHRTFAASGGPFQLDRLRHVIDLDAGFDGRYADDTPLTSVPAYDESDHVRDHTATSLRVRNRLQTRAQGGGIRTLLDLDVVGRYYLDERGPYLIDTPAQVTAYLRAQPRRNLYLAGEGEWNVGGGGFEKGFFGAGTRFSEDLVAVSGVRYIRGEAVAPVVDVSWRWSEKYGIRVRELYNVTRDENFARIVLGRYSQDHALFAGVSQRADHVDFQFNFQTTVGGGGLEAERTFNDEPSPQPFGVFPP